MTLLPQILYFFWALPIPIIKSQLQRLHQRLHQRWLNSSEVLKATGSLKQLCLAQLTQLLTIYSRTAHLDWIHMEKQATPNHTLDYLLWCPVKARHPILAPTLSYSFTLWDFLGDHSQIVSLIRPLSHIFHNPLFPPGLDITAFKWWLDKGLYRIGHYTFYQETL